MWLEDTRSKKLTKDHRVDIIQLVHTWIEGEIRSVVSTGRLNHKAHSFEPYKIEVFGFDKLSTWYSTHCPLTCKLLNLVVLEEKVERGAKKKTVSFREEETTENLVFC